MSRPTTAANLSGKMAQKDAEEAHAQETLDIGARASEASTRDASAYLTGAECVSARTASFILKAQKALPAACWGYIFEWEARRL